ncbi:MAG: hypothetical protein N2C14_11200, partial [Planctomycetales bacterium]
TDNCPLMVWLAARFENSRPGFRRVLKYVTLRVIELETVLAIDPKDETQLGYIELWPQPYPQHVLDCLTTDSSLTSRGVPDRVKSLMSLATMYHKLQQAVYEMDLLEQIPSRPITSMPFLLAEAAHAIQIATMHWSDVHAEHVWRWGFSPGIREQYHFNPDSQSIVLTTDN